MHRKPATVQAALLGLDALWAIAVQVRYPLLPLRSMPFLNGSCVQASTPAVRVAAMKLLVAVNMNVAATAAVTVAELQQKFVGRCLKHLSTIQM